MNNFSLNGEDLLDKLESARGMDAVCLTKLNGCNQVKGDYFYHISNCIYYTFDEL